MAEPLILSKADARTLGIAETICASGMLVTSLYLGFGVFESIVFITLSGFGFFMMLPFAGVALVIVSVGILFIKEIKLLEVKKGEER